MELRLRSAHVWCAVLTYGPVWILSAIAIFHQLTSEASSHRSCRQGLNRWYGGRYACSRSGAYPYWRTPLFRAVKRAGRVTTTSDCASASFLATISDLLLTNHLTLLQTVCNASVLSTSRNSLPSSTITKKRLRGTGLFGVFRTAVPVQSGLTE